MFFSHCFSLLLSYCSSTLSSSPKTHSSASPSWLVRIITEFFFMLFFFFKSFSVFSEETDSRYKNEMRKLCLHIRPLCVLCSLGTQYSTQAFSVLVGLYLLLVGANIILWSPHHLDLLVEIYLLGFYLFDSTSLGNVQQSSPLGFLVGCTNFFKDNNNSHYTISFLNYIQKLLLMFCISIRYFKNTYLKFLPPYPVESLNVMVQSWGQQFLKSL
jgi:hypothetical protein